MNFELESAILGSLLSEPNLMQRVVVSDQCFLDECNRFIFNLLRKQYNDFKTIDMVGLVENYKNEFNEKFTASNIILKLTEFMEEAVVATNFDYYQESLFSRYVENEIMKSINKFQSHKITKDELLDDIHKFESMSIKTDNNRLSAEEIFKLINSKNNRINFRFKKLCDAADIQEHDLPIIAARTGIGKSGFCLNLLEDLSSRYNCIYFNMEMAEKQLYQRLISINTGIAMKYLTDIQTDYQQEKVKTGCTNIGKKKIKVFNRAYTISNIRRIIINESKNEHTIVFIDHVGLIIQQKNTSIYESLTSIVKELIQISLNYNCTIFLVSQLNRSADDDSIPKMSELKDTGELEQSASSVIILHDENHSKNMSKDKIEMTFIVGKNRQGRTGMTKYLYNKENQRFDEE